MADQKHLPAEAEFSHLHRMLQRCPGEGPISQPAACGGRLISDAATAAHWAASRWHVLGHIHREGVPLHAS
ncbi:MAG: hypothetical protein VKO39_00565 [Cyanobacteriota bacterium]|nr:hypothetical protein [Cyanobacteriota bacterium]